MGLIEKVLTLAFGGGGNVVAQTAEVFRENSEAAAKRDAEMHAKVLEQFSKEFVQQQRGWFDRVMDGVNRVPRPAMALGTLGLFMAAMVDPLWFSERMQGIALVPEPLWWLLGAIVSFYFGARHQVKGQEFQRSIAFTMARAPQVMENVAALREMAPESPGAADPGPDARLALSAVEPGENAALEEWQRLRA